MKPKFRMKIKLNPTRWVLKSKNKVKFFTRSINHQKFKYLAHFAQKQ